MLIGGSVVYSAECSEDLWTGENSQRCFLSPTCRGPARTAVPSTTMCSSKQARLWSFKQLYKKERKLLQLNRDDVTSDAMKIEPKAVVKHYRVWFDFYCIRCYSKNNKFCLETFTLLT